MALTNNAHGACRFLGQLMHIERLIETDGSSFKSLEDLQMACWDSFGASENQLKLVRQFFGFWLGSDLWIVTANGIEWNRKYGSGSLGSRLAKWLVDKASTKNLFTSTDAESVMRAACVLMSVQGFTPRTLQPMSDTDIEKCLNRQMPDFSNHIDQDLVDPMANPISLLTNRGNELKPTIQWLFLVGILEPGPLNTWYINPVRLLKSFLPDIAEEVGVKTNIPIGRFLSVLSHHVPMVDGGKFFELVSRARSGTGFQGNDPNQIGAPLSTGLYALQAQGLLKFNSLSDDKNRIVFTPDCLGRGDEISSVEILNV